MLVSTLITIFIPFLCIRKFLINHDEDDYNYDYKHLHYHKFNEFILVVSTYVASFVNFFDLVIFEVEISHQIFTLHIQIAVKPVV